MFKKILFTGVSMLIFLLVDVELGILIDAIAQPEQNQIRLQKPGNGIDLSKAVQELLTMEKQTPTTSQNVHERYRSLTYIISKMLHLEKSIKDILSREEAQRIESLIKSGGMEEAAQLIHTAIMKLKDMKSDGPFEGEKSIRPLPVGTELTQSTQTASVTSLVHTVPLMKINIKELVTKNSMGNILKLGNVVIDSGRRRLYVTGTKSTYLGIIDLDRDELIETYDIGMPGGFILLDRNTADIYLFVLSENMFFKIDIVDKKVTKVPALPSYMSLPKKDTAKTYKNKNYVDTGYPFKVGYLQDANAAYGVIEVRDSSGKMVNQIKHGPDGLYFDIDEKTGKLYASNTGDGSISVFDLNKNNKKVKDIAVGVSLDQVLLNPKTSGIYVRNRLGGNMISYYVPKTNYLAVIPNENNDKGLHGIGMWPTGMIYDEGRLYVLSHFGAKVDVIDAVTNKVITHIPISLKTKPRTDNISTMVMDRTRKIIYAVFPEIGSLAVINAKDMKEVKILQFEDYDTSLANANPGPAKIILAVDEKLNMLYAYFSEQKALKVYDAGTLTFIKSISIEVKRIEQVMTSNPEKGILYLGNKVLDAKTLLEIGSFSKGERAIAFDNSKNTVYLSGQTLTGRAKIVEKVYKFEDSVLKKEWTLSPIISIPSTFAFDFQKNIFYAGYFESAVVDVFDLATGDVPSDEPPNSTPGGASDISPSGAKRQPPMGGGKGGCGDDICQPIEKEKGVCPDDCRLKIN